MDEVIRYQSQLVFELFSKRGRIRGRSYPLPTPISTHIIPNLLLANSTSTGKLTGEEFVDEVSATSPD